MITAAAAIERLDLPASSHVQSSTGFPELDRATGGHQPGRVWLVTGTPGQGRTALAIQWALAVAESGLSTQLLTTLPVAEVALRLLGHLTRTPTSVLRHQGDQAVDPARWSDCRQRLNDLPLSLSDRTQLSLLDHDPDEWPGAVVIDDAHREAGGATPARLRAMAGQGMAVVATLPRHLVLNEEGLDPAWAEVADVIVEVDRPDLLDRQSGRPAEADLHLLRNAWGPTPSVATVFHAHFGRFTR